jgi:hypothetical protein
MKKLNNLRGFLKQLSFTQNKNQLFKEEWLVSFNEEHKQKAGNLKEGGQK